MKMSPKAIKDHFNQMSRDGGEHVVRTEAEWKETGLWTEYGELPKGYMAICVFNGAVQENTQAIHIDSVKEDRAGLHVTVRTNIVGGPPSRPGHESSPHAVKFVPETRKPVTFDYVGIVPPRHRQGDPKP